ncbi:hypothetical protein ACE4WU_05055 [Enterococcus faecalis]
MSEIAYSIELGRKVSKQEIRSLQNSSNTANKTILQILVLFRKLIFR